MTRDKISPILKGFEGQGVHDPVDEWIPADDSEVHYTLTLEIGPAGGEGADLYDVSIVTPKSINALNLGRELSNSKTMVISPYSWENVISEIEAILDLCEGETYRERTAILCERFSWEGDY